MKLWKKILIVVGVAVALTIVLATVPHYASLLYIGEGIAEDLYVCFALDTNYHTCSQWIMWDESEDEYSISNDLRVNDTLTLGAGSETTQQIVFDNGGSYASVIGWDTSTDGLIAYSAFGDTGADNFTIEIGQSGSARVNNVKFVYGTSTFDSAVNINGITNLAGGFTADGGAFTSTVSFQGSNNIGAYPPSTCIPFSIFMDTDETDDTNCMTTNDNSLCLCVATNTWVVLENN